MPGRLEALPFGGIARDDARDLEAAGQLPRDPQVKLGSPPATDDPEALVRKAIKGARAIDNDMFTRLYRREMIGVYLRDSFNTVTAARM